MTYKRHSPKEVSQVLWPCSELKRWSDSSRWTADEETDRYWVTQGLGGREQLGDRPCGSKEKERGTLGLSRLIIMADVSTVWSDKPDFRWPGVLRKSMKTRILPVVYAETCQHFSIVELCKNSPFGGDWELEYSEEYLSQLYLTNMHDNPAITGSA